MEEQKITMTPEEYKEVYDGWMHKSLQVETEVMATYARQELDLLDKFVGHTQQILTSIGLIAGFGFTAIGKVQTLLLFSLGESLLVAAILLGLFWVKKFYESNIDSIQKSSGGLFAIYRERDEAFQRISDDFTKSQTVSKSDVELAMSKEMAVLEFIGKKDKKKKEYIPHNHILILAVGGFILMLGSFVIDLNTLWAMIPKR